VHPSDTAPALIVLDANIVTSHRTIEAENFFEVEVGRTTVLDVDEIVTEIQVPAPADGTNSTFIKFALRTSVDFPIVNCAAMISNSDGVVSNVRICLNAVYVKPYRVCKAEETILGKAIDESNAKAAGQASVVGAEPLKHNRYMVQVAKTLVKRAILACN
jgi:xanthine dehydrogenase YagS FAD-binding subunit